MKWKLTVHRFFKNNFSKYFFRLRHITPRHRCQLSIIRFVPKYFDQTLVHFSASPAGEWQTGCLWWQVVESRFYVDLKSKFALKNNSMEFLLGPITWRINVLYESRMKWTWHHSKLAVEEVSFFGGLRVVLLQLLSINDRAVGVTNLGVVLLCILPYAVWSCYTKNHQRWHELRLGSSLAFSLVKR